MRIGQAPAKSAFRQDIQALRGAAVLMVVLYHSGLKMFSAGYLGVDLFFVISGFLITGIIARQIEKNRFSFIDFYGRRVRRLLPAAYTVLIATSLASATLLTTTQYRQFLINLAGSIFFSANFTLWAQTGYFAPNSAYEPLLHMWSLAIEEQYYLLLPLTLFFIPSKFWLRILVAVSSLSLIGGLILATAKPSVAFFWLPPRAWELGVGSISALIWRKEAWQRLANTLLVPSLAAIAVLPIWELPGVRPGLGAVLVCLASALIIVADNKRVQAFLLTQPLARIGDFSYSLYLVHWPIFALFRATRMTPEIPWLGSLLLIGASFVLAALLYRFVEEPLRRLPIEGRKLFLLALGSSVAVLMFGWSLGQMKHPVPGSEQLNTPIKGLAEVGCFDQEMTQLGSSCTQSSSPEILLWGDSYSAHLVPGLDSTTQHPIVQASKGHCSPFVNYAAVATPNEYEWTKGCLSFNRSVVEFAHTMPSLKVVVLSGQYYRSLEGQSAYAVRTASAGVIARAPLGLNATVQAQRETVALLRSLGLRVVVVSPPPPSEFDLGNCWQRRAEGLLNSGPHHGCSFMRKNEARSRLEYDAMMRGFERVADVPVIWLERSLCDPERCAIQYQGKPVFRDDGHFTPWGSLVIGHRLTMGERAWRLAR